MAQITVETKDATCEGKNDGIAIVHLNTSVAGVFKYSVDGKPFQSSNFSQIWKSDLILLLFMTHSAGASFPSHLALRRRKNLPLQYQVQTTSFRISGNVKTLPESL